MCVVRCWLLEMSTVESGRVVYTGKVILRSPGNLEDENAHVGWTTALVTGKWKEEKGPKGPKGRTAQRLYSAGRDCCVVAWDFKENLRTNEVTPYLRSRKCMHAGWIHAMCLMPQSKTDEDDFRLLLFPSSCALSDTRLWMVTLFFVCYGVCFCV